MMSARQMMRMRAEISRDVNTTPDAWNADGVPDFQPHGDPIPCFAFSRMERAVVDGTKVGVVRVVVMLHPRDADITEHDHVEQITDRRGNVLFSGPFQIDTIERRPDHKETRLFRVE